MDNVQNYDNNNNSVALVRERNIPTERQVLRLTENTPCFVPLFFTPPLTGLNRCFCCKPNPYTRIGTNHTGRNQPNWSRDNAPIREVPYWNLLQDTDYPWFSSLPPVKCWYCVYLKLYNDWCSIPDEVNFSFYLILPAALGPGVYSASNINEYQKQKNDVSGE
jgi:hypothetical protein